MTRPDHTAVPPAGVIAAAELKPCPFCGGTATPMHTEDCYFSMQQKLRDAPKGDLSLVPEVLAAWNRRAEGAAPTAAQAAEPKRDLYDELVEGFDALAAERLLPPLPGVRGGGYSKPHLERMLREYALSAIGRRPADVRQAFEAWAANRDQDYDLSRMGPNPWWSEDVYKSRDTHFAWEVWQAAAASHAPHATLAPQPAAESATSGATSAAKVELEKAARNAALEAAAVVCEATQVATCGYWYAPEDDGHETKERIAAAIRALKSE